jgi:hypothetical protein
MEFTKEEIKTYIDQMESELFNADKIKFTFDKNWSSNFPSKAGIYAVFDKDALRYVGETANLKERMKEVKRTVNHSFRRKLGRSLVQDATVTNENFMRK